MVMGRPTIYTDELASQICEEVAKGKALTGICRRDDMPSLTQVYKWLSTKDNFAEEYDFAKQSAMEYLAEEILEIGDDTNASIHDRRLRTDLRKWNMARIAPKGRKDQKEANQIVTQGDMEEALNELAGRFAELAGGK